MRRWLTVVALGGVVTLAFAGCSTPEGVDRDLTDDWAALSEPVPFVPEKGTCHPEFDGVGYLSLYRPVDCAEKHMMETIHVGAFTGEHAAHSSVPQKGSPALRTAWQECHAKATEALGADWRTARLAMTVVLPSGRAWSGGARWFRCDLSEVDDFQNDTPVARTGSLAGALQGSSPLSLGCFNPRIEDDHVAEMVPVSCDKPHNSEFVGIYTAPDTTYAAFEKAEERTHRECLSVVARYAGLPDNRDMQYRTGTIFFYPPEEEWKAGNRGVQCFLWVDRKLTRSAKGAGAKVLPVS